MYMYAMIIQLTLTGKFSKIEILEFWLESKIKRWSVGLSSNLFFGIRITQGSLAEMAESLAILDQKYHIGILTNLSTKPRKFFIKNQQNLDIFSKNSTKPRQFFTKIQQNLKQFSRN